MRKTAIFFSLILFAMPCMVPAQTADSFTPGMHARLYARPDGKGHDMKYLLFLPEGYGASDKKWPLILYLHGASIRGRNLSKVERYGIPWEAKNRKNFPFIVIAPLCPSGIRWVDMDDGCIMGLVDSLLDSLSVDTDRVYVTGVSMGGHGAWYLASRYPERFAAVAPLCGRVDTKWAEKLVSVPAWVFHGSKDRVCPIRYSDGIVEALAAGGGNVRYTVYPGGGHDIVMRTYGNDMLYDWLLAQRKNTARGKNASPDGH